MGRQDLAKAVTQALAVLEGVAAKNAHAALLTLGLCDASAGAPSLDWQAPCFCLQVLNLSHNNLSRVVTITELPALRALIVNDNHIESVQGEIALHRLVQHACIHCANYSWLLQ